MRKWTHTTYKARCNSCATTMHRLDRKKAEQAALEHIRERRGRTIVDCDVQVIRSFHQELSRVTTSSVVESAQPPQCSVCLKHVWPVTHSCKGVAAVNEAASEPSS